MVTVQFFHSVDEKYCRQLIEVILWEHGSSPVLGTCKGAVLAVVEAREVLLTNGAGNLLHCNSLLHFFTETGKCHLKMALENTVQKSAYRIGLCIFLFTSRLQYIISFLCVFFDMQYLHLFQFLMFLFSYMHLVCIHAIPTSSVY